jgi:signal transduction histidine kinase/purine-cytosine permease-like protein/FixJ family two-component response regulator
MKTAPCQGVTDARISTPQQTDGNAPNDVSRAPVQRIIKVRRDYNSWVASETMEDYALRFTPSRFRRWSALQVANTAFGASSFLILEAVGATLLVQYGFVNAFWAIVATGLIIALAGLPISVYAARHGVDMDLLTRGAGFGYIGSTITSLIYASFTFIFFALEAAVMAYALELAFSIPPAWGYLVCALVVVPLVTHGVSTISKLQVWTQPLWLAMLVVPYVAVWMHEPGAFFGVMHYGGEFGLGSRFNLLYFGAALTVGIALITQMGEQADYLRFMPAPEAGPSAKARQSRRRWWFAVVLGGPGWVALGVVKMLGGALLAYLAITQMVPTDRAVDPNQMYLAAYNYVFPNYGWAVAATALFVVMSQLKINVTNAYAGSLAWSNFFSRLTHSHPGRVVWVVFNTLIAFMLMEMNVFQALGQVLGLYSNIAIAWIMAVVADLVVNKPLGLSPKGIEFKRAHLYDINPVGVGAMGLASVLSFVAHMGLLGPMAQAFSALIAMVTAFVAAPLIAWATRGRYYIARESQAPTLAPEGAALPPEGADWPWGGPAANRSAPTLAVDGAYLGQRLQRCVICEREYEGPDMAHCPAYQGAICSLCCTLDARCGDLCKPHAKLSVQWAAALRHLMPRKAWPHLDAGLGHYLLLMLVIAPLLAAVLGLLYRQEVQGLLAGVGMGWVDGASPASESVAGDVVAGHVAQALGSSFMRVYAALLLVLGLVAWWLVLAHKSREVAQVESNRQTELLMQEIESHRRTDEQLQQAREAADRAREAADHARVVAEQARAAADQANQAKTRYISTISHELRTPLNSILGYAQMLHEDTGLAPHRAQAVKVIHRGGEHLLSLIEGTLDIARIESGKLTLEMRPMAFADGVAEMAGLFEHQARAKGLDFRFEPQGKLPATVRADEKRVRQILINLLGNAVKFTQRGQVVVRVGYAREMAQFEVIDSGPGMAPAEVERVFEPFARGSAAGGQAQGTGLGLTIAKMLTDLMGGEMSVASELGHGTTFKVRLFLPELRHEAAGLPPDAAVTRPRVGYEGPRRRVLVVDNEESDRELLQRWLEPLGFDVTLATSGHDALHVLHSGCQPDAVLMDLAMPGIDGWETLRRIQRLEWNLGRTLPAAIVSANAFDQALDNDVGITPADFLVKPVRRDDLLDWLGNKLGLTWRRDAVPEPQRRAAVDQAIPWWPEPRVCERLLSSLHMGHVRGVARQLDALSDTEPASGAFVQQARAWLGEFQLDTLERWLKQGLPGVPEPLDGGHA